MDGGGRGGPEVEAKRQLNLEIRIAGRKQSNHTDYFNDINTFIMLEKRCAGLKAILRSGRPDMDYPRRKWPDGLVCHPKQCTRLG